MKKIYKLILITATLLVTLISCSNDSSKGILDTLLEAQHTEKYTINAMEFNNSLTPSNKALIILEDNKISRIYNNEQNPTLLVNSVGSYANMKDIYTNNDKIYFTAHKANEKNKLYYFDISNINNISEVPIDSSLGDIKSLTPNGYIITQKDSTIFISQVTTTINSSKASFNLLAGHGYASYALNKKSSSELIINTTTTEKDTFSYNLFNGLTFTEIANDKTSKIVAYSTNDSNIPFYLLENGDILKSTFSSAYSNQSSSDKIYIQTTPYIIQKNSLIVMNQIDNKLYLFDVTDMDNVTRDDTSSSLKVAYAQDLNNSSLITGIIEDPNTAGKYWVSTNKNGFYTITIDPTNPKDVNSSVSKSEKGIK